MSTAGTTLPNLVFGCRRLGRRAAGVLSRLGLRPLPLVLVLSLGVFLIGLMAYGLQLYALVEPLWYEVPDFRELLVTEGGLTLIRVIMLIVAIGAVAQLIAVALGQELTPGRLSVLRKAYIVGYGMLFAVAYGIYDVTGAVENAALALPMWGEPDAVVLFFWRWALLWPLGLLFFVLAFGHLMAWRRPVINLYYRETAPTPAVGDKIVESMRSHGRDPVYRKSVLSSFGMHFMVIIAIPFLLKFWGCADRYSVPKGDGNPVVTLVKMVQPKKKEKKSYVLRPNSAIYFSIPELEESEIEKQVDQQTQVRYSADASAVHGKPGQGGKGGGWPDGMEDARVRFIRLEYRGPDWDDGMDARTRADMNFMEAFHERTGFKVADHSEHITVRELLRFEKGYAPPFLYITGSGGINIPSQDLRALRSYLLDGGMLFADAGSARFDRSFRGLMQSVFPDKPLITISDDDPIFQYPYVFPDGAPPLWHHGGFKAQGIKHQNRWIVFYHPGDINDAWKTGHSGMDKDLAEASFDLGVNIIYYAFTRYLEETRKYRK